VGEFNMIGCVAWSVVGMAFLAGGPRSKPVNVQLTGASEQLVQGQANTLKAFGDDLPLLGIEVSPPEGVSSGDMKEDGPDEAEINPPWAKKNKYWSVSLKVDPAAVLGKRTVVLITPKGRSQPKEIEIVTHRPRISDLKVVSAKKRTMEVTFVALDEKSDLGADPPIRWMLACGAKFSFNSSPAKVTQIEQADATSGTVHATLTLTEPPVSNSCELQLQITDKTECRSNDLKATVNWK
jgi:hypothetical protein